MDKDISKRYTVGEEIFNSVSHGVGAVLAIVGATVLVTLSVCFGDGLCIFSSLVYGLSLVILYTMSTLYHAFPMERVKRIFRIFDHTSIFILIAGTYTPFCLLALRGHPRGIAVAVLVWVCAIIGVIMNAVSLKKTEKLSLVLYVIMGWSILLIIRDVLTVMTPPEFWYLLLGGVSYTVGIIFYKMDKVRYMHSVWHLFVLLGSILHYISVAVYVLPAAF